MKNALIIIFTHLLLYCACTETDTPRHIASRSFVLNEYNEHSGQRILIADDLKKEPALTSEIKYHNEQTSQDKAWIITEYESKFHKLPHDKKGKEKIPLKNLFEVLKTGIHIVRENELLEDIAEIYNISPNMIRIWNDIDNNQELYPDEELQIKVINWTTQKVRAGYYGENGNKRKYNGKLMANGERYSMWSYIGAHRVYPLNSMIRVTNPEEDITIHVVITDFGPFEKDNEGYYSKDLQLSYGAAQRLKILKKKNIILIIKLG